MSRHWAALLAAAAIVLACSLAACAPAGQDESTGDSSQSASEAEQTADTDTGDPIDPEQATKRSGIALGFGGPSNGDLGDQVLDNGQWCQGVTMFWSPQVPEGVTFTVTDVFVDTSDFRVESGTCLDYTPACEDVSMGPQDFFQCGIVLTPLVESPAVTRISIVGDIDCATADECTAMDDFAADQGVYVTLCGADSAPCDSEPTRQE